MSETPKPKKDLICPQGKTFRRTIVGRGAGGSIWNLTNYSARIEVRNLLPTDPNSEVLVRLTTENGGIEIDTVEDESRLVIKIEAEVTATFPVGNYIWELEVESPDGEVPYLMSPSKFKVLAENTL